MPKKGHRRVKKTTIIIGAILVTIMAINWFMTYRLEDTLRKRLRTEVVNATNGLYDFSFDKLSVGLFSGELLIEGLSLWPDSNALKILEDSAVLPNLYADVKIDTISFKGINLTWLFDYRMLSFDQFSIKQPTIKISSIRKEHISSLDSLVVAKSIYETISPFFDVIHAQHINLSRANVEYIVMDSVISSYSLKDFDFTAQNFLLDKDAHKKEHLLYSDNFYFSTKYPQVIFDSEHFLLSIDSMKLSTIDSVAQVAGAFLQTKYKYWDKRHEIPGSYSSVEVGDVKLKGIILSREGSYNSLDARNLNINAPKIEYYDVADNGASKTLKKNLVATDSLSITSWSLYSLTSPIVERIAINEINIGDAKMMYTKIKEDISDVYTLNKLDFFAKNFLVDSLHRDYNILTYVNDFSIEAKDVQGYISSKNAVISLTDFNISSIEKRLKLSNVNLYPISLAKDKDYAYGKIKDFEITNIRYGTGLDADLMYIHSPELNYVKAGNKSVSHKTGNQLTNANAANQILDIVAPFISYISVKDIIVNDANTSFWDKKGNHTYQLKNLSFYARNFHIDKETRRLRDYFFRWDEYNIKFKDFDNLTPDKKYRIQIKQGDFDSVTGDMLLTDLRVTPEPTNKGSHISIVTPSATLLALDQKKIRQRKISFKTFILESPVIEIVKEDDKVAREVEESVTDIAVNYINFDLLTIPSPSIFFYDRAKGSSTQIQSHKVHVDSLRWELNKKLSVDNLIVESPYISVVETQENISSAKKGALNISSFGVIDIGRVNIRKPILKVKRPNMYLDFSAENYLLKSLHWNHTTNSILEVGVLDFISPNLYVNQTNVKKKETKAKPITRGEIIRTISAYANRTKLGRINISDLNLRHHQTKTDGLVVENKLVNTHLLIEKLDTDLERRKLDVDEIAFSTKDIDYPLMDDFYTLRIKDINFSKRNATLDIDNIRLDPNYPKFDFAYIHPTGKDWFDIEVGKISLSGVDASKLITDTTLFVKKMLVDHVNLQNLKNQKITIEHNIMPLLYEEFQRFPLKYHISDLDIRDFNVIYEELAKNGYQPARIPFSKMNGHVKDFTNIQKNDSATYTLHVDGLAMGAAPFTAAWTMPVDSTNDKFYLTASIKELDMRYFNQLVRPMAPAYVRSGIIKDLNFNTEANSLGAIVDMQFEYDSLYIVLLKNMKTEEENAQLTRLINRWGIESYNHGKNFRTSHMDITRNPYHSNFNYFWQILQPPLVESVGISEEKQNLANNLIVIFNRIKRFLGIDKKEEKKKKE